MTKLNSKDIYADLKQALGLAWDEDDLISQENLFELQELLANLTLKVAQDCGKLEDLAHSFPYLYTIR